MNCSALDLSSFGIIDFLRWPSSCDGFFWLKVNLVFGFILSFILYRRDEERFGTRADIISCLGVSSIAVISVSLIMTFLDIINNTNFIWLFCIEAIFLVLWWMKD